MLYWMINISNTILTKAQLLHAIKRNFDGYDDSELDPVKTFEKLLRSYAEFNVSYFPDTYFHCYTVSVCSFQMRVGT